VSAGTKVIEIDPRDVDADIYGIGERPRRHRARRACGAHGPTEAARPRLA
jgi:hypothetical protein